VERGRNIPAGAGIDSASGTGSERAKIASVAEWTSPASQGPGLSASLRQGADKGVLGAVKEAE